MTEKDEEYPIEIQAGSIEDGGFVRFNNSNYTNLNFSGDYIFNRMDTKICLILAYTFVFCCCFFGILFKISSFGFSIFVTED
ncbi:hypothetical protein CEXT_185831 [Caerostris extrusa]|uniref:Uncharacterized protein n=1 Tax=Caerostris extrusa TaxID=172846 RepID=A0AAV4M8K8_CAEEX|nr:hypothetical protein CEXT_185831 [Caerostris extrusa]